MEHIALAYERNQPCDVFVCAAHNNERIYTYLKELGTVLLVPQAKIQKVDDATVFKQVLVKKNEQVSKRLLKLF